MGFWFTLILFTISTIASRLLQPRVSTDQGREADLPTTEEGRTIPVIWGTHSLESPMVLWYGRVGRQVMSGTGRERTTQTVYSMIMHHMLCHGEIDEVIDIRFDKKSPPLTKVVNATYTRVSIDRPNLIVGGDNQIGVVADFDIYRGGTAQTGDTTLASAIGIAAVPGYRGMCHVVINARQLGASPFLVPIAYVVRRTPNQLGLSGGKHLIQGGSGLVGSGDANPACMIYEVMTNNRWGCGLSPSLIDVTSLITAGNTLFDEGFGMSMIVDRPTEGQEIIGEILRHIDGVIYTEPTTGLLTLKLARADYTLGSLPTFNQSNSRNPKFSRPSWSELHNVVKVKFTDRFDGRFMQRIAQAINLSMIPVLGGRSTADLDFPGISLPEVARKVAARELKSQSYPIAPVELELNREAWDLRPGSVIKWSWPPFGITDMALRIRRMGSGTLLDGWIPVEVVEDVFGINWTAYPAATPSGWVDPIAPPVALAAQRLLEEPYQFAAGDFRRVLTLGVRGAGVTNGYQVWTDPSGGSTYLQTEDVPFLTPSGLLGGALTYTATTLTISAGGVDMLQLASVAAAASCRNILLVDDELIAWHTVTDNGDGTYTISGLSRGVLDTTPKSHSTSARVWFVTSGVGETAADSYAADLTLTAKLLPYNSAGVLPIGSATQLSVTTASRALRPYVPTAVLLNGAAYPATIVGALTVSWAHRNRLGAWGYADSGLTATPQPGTTYTLRLYGTDTLLKRTYSGLTGTSQEWTTEAADSGGSLNTSVRVELEAVVGGLVSHQIYNFTVAR